MTPETPPLLLDLRVGSRRLRIESPARALPALILDNQVLARFASRADAAAVALLLHHALPDADGVPWRAATLADVEQHWHEAIPGFRCALCRQWQPFPGGDEQRTCGCGRVYRWVARLEVREPERAAPAPVAP